jgi:outer membrane immunogenic protein
MKKVVLLAATIAGLIATPALAADMALKAPPRAVPETWSWTGWYVGGNVGGKWADTSGSAFMGASALGAATSPAATVPFASDTATTVIGGGQLGYNWQTGPTVLGLEGDFDAQHWREMRTLTGTVPGFFIPGDNFTTQSNWQASIRGRLGYALDRNLLYVTGGAAFTNIKVGTNFIVSGIFPASSASDSKTLVGATFGGGLEHAFTRNWSVGIEGRYTWYGSQTYNGGAVATIFNGTTFAMAPATQTIKLDTAEVMGKINYHF